MKTAIITGASRGIGLELTRQLLSNGWSVYGLSRTKPSVEADPLFWIECDLSDSASISSALKQITDTSIDLFVSNAGVAFEEPASKANVESYTKMFSVNVLAPMLIVNTLKDRLDTSTIISISSVADRLTEKNFALYCSSKAANTRYFESLSDEFDNAKVITLLPDYVDTPMLRELQKEREFNWGDTLSPQQVATLCMQIESGEIIVPSGSNIIVVNEALKEDLKPAEKLYGYNVDTGELIEI